MATISIEFGKESSQKTREVYLLVRQGKTRQRVKTGVRLNEQEYSPKTKKIKSIEKARIVEKLRLDLIDNMSNLAAGAMAGDPDDAHTMYKEDHQEAGEEGTGVLCVCRGLGVKSQDQRCQELSDHAQHPRKVLEMPQTLLPRDYRYIPQRLRGFP